jgi:hypothetical protein
MVHRLPDVLMQIAWSLTAFVIWRSAKVRVRATFLADFKRIKSSRDSEHENYAH